MADGKIIIDTQVDSKGAEKGINELSGIANKGLKGIGTAIAGVGVAMGSMGGFALKTGVDFESAFTGVKKTVDGTDEQFAQLEKAIRNMAKSMPESASEIAGVAEAAGQLGIKTENIEGFTKSMVMLGDSTNMSSEEAATALARLANITQMPQTQFDRLGSVIVALGNNLATTESEITAMGLRLAGAGHQVGMSEAQILSFAGALSSVGIEAEAGGSAFSKVMVDMQLAVEKGGEGLNKFAKVAGMSSSEFQKAFKEDASSAIIAFIQGLGKCQESGQSAIGVLDDMGIKEVRMRDALLRAAGAGDVFTDALKLGTKAWDENIALTKEAETRYATTESKMKMIKNSIVDLGITMFEKFKEPFRKSLDSVMESLDKLSDNLTNGPLGESVDKLASSFGRLIESIAKGVEKWLPIIIDSLAWIIDNGGNIIPVIASIVTAMEGAKIALTIVSIIKKVKELGGVINVLKLGLAAIGGPIGLVIIAIAAVVVGLVTLWNTNEDFRNAVIGAWNAILDACKTVWKWIVDFFTVDIPAAWQSVLDFFSGIPEWFANLWSTIQQAFVDGWNAIVNFFTQTIPEWINNIVEWFNNLPYLIGFALGYVLTTIIKWGVDTWNYLSTNVPIWINNVVNFFATLPGRIWTWLVNTISRVAQFAGNLASTARSAGANMVSNIINAVRNLPSQFLNIGRNIVQGVWNGITGMGGWIRDRVNGFFGGIVDGAKAALGIHSPSRVFRDQVGKYMAQGVGVGFENETENIKKSMEKDLSGLVSKMQMTVDHEVATTTAGVVASRNALTSSTITTNNDNGLNVNIENFNNTKSQDVQSLMEELEFYRKQNSLARGGV
ncbi:TPA: phage tail tape measure protein [Clostridium botulinum]|uniref:phage tail tape measure protein n=1 Tax=Clostridium botulinum TaxID=1491 RepID=UPI0029B9CC47|nr:phage tail tape measure protein [Clostridium botulinum]HDK7188703.1 phage tail tape measure protein [Clostridium botulinum]HDK7215622.1 phage tail tape measure protein [Clostridium botulinum]HDK7231376.1 phage tail tape measure protein [Clostridium botulinum]HDK7260734.1 phage tail tape measure protein [Clostridium botulinum]